MTASSRGAYALLALLRNSPNICSRCASRQLKAPSRAYSAIAAAPIEAPPQTPSLPETSPRRDPKQEYKIKSGIILSRPPLLTRRPTLFESAFYFYQKRLNERTCLPFITSVYFKPDTAPLFNWNLKVKERQGTVAKELGVYKGKSGQAWDDELRVGDPLSAPESITEALLRDAEVRVSDEAEEIPEHDRVPVERPQPRETEADRANDVRRLDRELSRTLYLVVQDGKGAWVFPNASLPTDENLHEAAKRVLDTTAGPNINTWIIGRIPIAHHVAPPVFAADGSLETKGEKVFFIKGRIMAGQVNLKDNPFGYVDFRWLTKEELAETLAPEYYHSVLNAMPDR